LGFDPGGDQNDERISGFLCAYLKAHVVQTRSAEQSLELDTGKPQPLVAKTRSNPRFLVFAQIEHEQPSSRTKDAHGFSQASGCVWRVVKRL
jgi:hypothetical protein